MNDRSIDLVLKTWYPKDHSLHREILDRPHITVALNFPGIGYGGLNRNEVLPIISILPDNVEIWEKE